MTRPRFIIGIDLGTSNCAVAYVDTKGRERFSPDIQTFAIPQLVAPGETGERMMLPSFLYLPGTADLPAGAAKLPWNEEADRIVGEFARAQGARVPSRLVSSAKSWLCHGGVDREADILPWGAPTEVKKVSPVEASADFLKHLRDSWNASMTQGNQDLFFQRQELVLTVPASFDEAARELTLQAAKKAGLDHVVLLEEPQAAFYCWIVTHQDGWQNQVRSGELILVCDVGGGTTDFSLITVVETPTGPGFRRVAVGDHLMLGGDNIDLALAHLVEKKLGGARLDPEQWSALRFACRTAKEKLLDDRDPPDRWPVTIAGRGSRLIGSSLQSELSLAEVRTSVVDGFFPFVPREQDPSKTSRLGLQEFGLPFVADPAITRHLGAFLRRHKPAPISPSGFSPDDRPARPDAILFNGGALTPKILRNRIVDVVQSWFADEGSGSFSPRVLSNSSLDLAVAQGAAYYGVVRRGGGIRIGGGTARSFYVGLEVENPKPHWLCVVPRDAREGDEIVVANRDFELLMGRPVLFPLAASSVRPLDRPGDVIEPDPDSLRELPPLRTSMRTGRKAKSETIPVRLAARVTEVGTIELWCQSRGDERRWKLEIQFRTIDDRAGRRQPATMNRDVLEQAVVDACVQAVRDSFAKVDPHAPQGPERLVKRLEETLELPRADWPPAVLRALWEPLRDAASDRLRTARHESRWFNLAGYCLRPGVGFPLDDLRMKALWPIFHAGVHFSKDVQSWGEWWVLWRRVAAGLNKAHHDEIFRRIGPILLGAKTGGLKRPSRPKPEPHELAEMWRCAAALERLPAQVKQALGDELIQEWKLANLSSYSLWCLGRLGARVPLFAPANTVVPRESAEKWTSVLLERPPGSARETRDLIFALSQLARVSGDRTRDLQDSLRERIIGKLESLSADESALIPLREYRELESSREGEALGDSLPVGLRLARIESANEEATRSRP